MATPKSKLMYHCVEIVPCTGRCAASAEMTDVRILVAHAPQLPLPACDRPQECNCSFRHHEERRVGPRRASERKVMPTALAPTNRRRLHGRRETDFD